MAQVDGEAHAGAANLGYAREKVLPAGGIYACWAYVRDERYKAAVNLGTNPTFTPDKQTLNVEAYLFDFDRDIYGEMIGWNLSHACGTN